MNPHQLYDFAKIEIPSITCFFVVKQQVDVVLKFLISRCENARQFRGSRKKHQFISSGGNILMSWVSGVDFQISNLIEDPPGSVNIEVIPQKFYACHYENNWYFGIANYVSIENNDVNEKFMHPKGPASIFFGPVRMRFAGFLLKILYVKWIFQRPVLLDDFMFLKKLISRGYSWFLCFINIFLCY